MRILAVLPCQPFPAHNGQTHRLSHVVRALAERHETSLACFVQPGDASEPPAEERGRFAGVFCAPTADPAAGTLSRLARHLSRDPSDVARFRSAAMRARVDAVIAQMDPDVILLGDPALVQYLPPGRRAWTALDYVCETALQLERMRDRAHGFKRLLWEARRSKYAAFLRRTGDQVDVAFLNSREDLDSLTRFMDPARLAHVPNGLVPEAYPLDLAAPTPGRMIYAGSVLYPPNRDAITWFANAILPAIRARIPGAELYVTGAYDDASPQAEGVVYTGRVEDVRREIAAASISVVPLRLGAGGARFKVIESMALGTPIVGTAIGVEGLEIEDGRDYLAAETADGFAAACIDLLSHPERRDAMAANARRLIETRYNWTLLSHEIEDRIAALVARSADRAA